MAICRKATVNDLRVDVCCTHLDPEYVLNNNGTHVWWAEEKKRMEKSLFLLMIIPTVQFHF